MAALRYGPPLRLAALMALTAGSVACGDDRTEVAEVPAASPAPAIPERPFAPPTGPHPVGVVDVFWTDRSREELFTKDPDDRRAVAARVWYPAREGDGGAPYLPDTAEFRGDEELGRAFHVRTNATSGALPASGGPFPVLIYNHGGGWTRFSSTFTTEEMASHGYVVISVGHNGFNRSRYRPDGSSVIRDTLDFPDPTGMLLEDAYASWDYLGDLHFPVWMDDARYALDEIEDMNEAGLFAGVLDEDKVGMYGWSFGGATSIEAAVQDTRVKAAVDHDGQLFGVAPRAGTDRPFMLLRGGAPPQAPQGDDPEAEATARLAMEELMRAVEDTYASFKRASTGEWYDVTIAGANHGNFSDLVLMVPGSSPGIDPRRAHAIINALTLAFFDRYLKGVQSPLLEDPAAGFPEVTIQRSSG